MDIVIDTNVVAYALLPAGPASEVARKVLAEADLLFAPDLLRAELANALWQWVRFRDVDTAVALDMLTDADALLGDVTGSDRLWTGALQLAVDYAHPVYDTLFVALARRLSTHVVTFDRRLRAVFPDDVWTAAEFLAAAGTDVVEG